MLEYGTGASRYRRPAVLRPAAMAGGWQATCADDALDRDGRAPQRGRDAVLGDNSDGKPSSDDEPLVVTDRLFVKHGYAPPVELIHYLKNAAVQRVLVCGIQADTCCLAAGFLLFDAGLHPTMLKWLTVGSSLDRSAELGARLWRHHFGQNSVIDRADDLER